MSKGQRVSNALRGYAAQEPDRVKKGVLIHAAEHVEELEQLERQYFQRLGEMARLSGIVCGWTLENGGAGDCPPAEVVEAAHEIMEYVEAVRP